MHSHDALNILQIHPLCIVFKLLVHLLISFTGCSRHLLAERSILLELFILFHSPCLLQENNVLFL